MQRRGTRVIHRPSYSTRHVAALSGKSHFRRRSAVRQRPSNANVLGSRAMRCGPGLPVRLSRSGGKIPAYLSEGNLWFSEALRVVAFA